MAIRGRLLFAETLRRRPALRDRHWCRHSHFTPDVLENRILRWTAFCLQPLRYKEKPLVGRLRRIGLVLAGVELDPEARRLFERLEYHRLNDPYRPALALARLILDHFTFSGTAGGNPFLAYLVDMNWLFEKYVSAILKRVAVGWGMSLVEQDRNPLDMRRRVVVKPDVVLYRGSAPHLVIDAKYKLAAAHGDLYQMVAYCHALGLTQAILVHPMSESAPEGIVFIQGPGAMQVHYLALDLRGDPTQLDKQGWTLARQVESLLSA
jgi:5-methylcytosine-specific restriction enzyme subunit McrC